MLGESSELTGQSRFRALLKRVADGESAATETLISEYGRHILRAVRRRMNQDQSRVSTSRHRCSHPEPVPDRRLTPRRSYCR